MQQINNVRNANSLTDDCLLYGAWPMSEKGCQ